MSETKEDMIYSRIRAAAKAGTLSHAFIISGEGDREKAALYLAAAMECVSDANAPCMKCAACRKVMSGVHPDVIRVEDAEHKIIPLSDMRDLRADMYIIPNEGRRKVYVFPDSAQLDTRCQDIMLKTVEEGPERAAFIFCAENPSTLLATIRSRCIELRLSDADAAAGDSPMLSQALEMCDYISRKKEAPLIGFFTALETSRLPRESLSPLFDAAREVCAAALTSLYGRDMPEIYEDMPRKLSKSLTKAQLTGIIDMLEKYRDESDYNVGVGHTLGAAGAEIARILGE